MWANSTSERRAAKSTRSKTRRRSGPTMSFSFSLSFRRSHAPGAAPECRLQWTSLRSSANVWLACGRGTYSRPEKACPLRFSLQDIPGYFPQQLRSRRTCVNGPRLRLPHRESLTAPPAVALHRRLDVLVTIELSRGRVTSHAREHDVAQKVAPDEIAAVAPAEMLGGRDPIAVGTSAHDARVAIRSASPRHRSSRRASWACEDPRRGGARGAAWDCAGRCPAAR